MSAKNWRHARQGAQALSLLLFLYLLLGTRQNGSTFLPTDLFFRLDPLAALTTTLAGRHLVFSLALALVTLGATIAFGRAWCGWVCPLGTVLDLAKLRRQSPDGKDLPLAWRQVKHLLLLCIVFAALLGNPTLMVLDPITLLFRTLAAPLLPALNVLVTASETVLYELGPLRGPLELFEGMVRGALLPPEPRYFEQNFLLAAVFAGVLGLNAIRPRFWCRYLCPLGALLGLVSKLSWLRQAVDRKACVACGKCAQICPTGTVVPERGFVADPAECTLCLNCPEVCPTRAIALRGHKGAAAWHTYDPSRRQAIASFGMVLLGIGLFRSAPGARREPDWLIRPPGARENGLVSKCIRCGECLKVCPTAGLQPSLTTAGWEGLWTPVLVARLGYCDYSCTSCGQVCPTEAIPRLSLEEKRRAVIGLAYIDKDRCIPWEDARDCIVCEEMCPVAPKAIRLDDETVANAQGEMVTVRRPRVIRDRCIGCGICETRCPLNGEAAIRIYVPNDLESGTRL